jgi:hypothetical protein
MIDGQGRSRDRFDGAERSELEGLVRHRGTAQGLARRPHIVLLASDGIENKEVAARLGAMPNTVGNSVGALPNSGSMAFTMSRAPARRGRSGTRRLPRRSG